MLTKTRIGLFCYLLAASAISFGQAHGKFSEEGVKQCLSCHDFGPESPVHRVLGGSHASIDTKGSCETCHGPSAAHTQAPTQTSPGVSYGPRWSATTDAQDGQCLNCHEANVAAHWRDALHMLNNLSCTTCHDIHEKQDKVLQPRQQAEVCTTCHKVQKKGIHGIEKRAKRNPACSGCHNPHDHESAAAKMLGNRSEGCRTCHNLEKMATRSKVSERAKSYHKVMENQDRTCLDCHTGVAHAEADSVSAMVQVPVSKKQLTLFYPGVVDTDWLLQGHPGSQPLRQGANCQQCHRGDEAKMGAKQAVDTPMSASSRNVEVRFSHDDGRLHVTLQWQGPEDDADIAMMWGDGSSDSFRRGGCFAACHSDLPGMSRDRGQQTEKYLWVSRSQQHRIGQPSMLKDKAELSRLIEEGDFVEMWRVQLDSGAVETATLLADVNWQAAKLIEAQTSYKDGHWTVDLWRSASSDPARKQFTPEGRYTFGLALHGAENPGNKHWVSLPLSFSFEGNDTALMVE